MKRFLLAISIAMFFTASAQAEYFSLPTVQPSMTDPIFSTLAAAFAFRPMETASDLGATWGIAVGVGGSATSTSLISGIFTGLPASYVPNADIQLDIGMPKGFTLELGAIPSMALDGTTFSKYEAGLKWTLTRTLLQKLPFSLAVAVQYGKSSLSYNQALSGGTVAVSYGDSMYGGMLLASKYLGAIGIGIEPYAGVGTLYQSSSLSGTGTASLFGSSYPVGTDAISNSDATLWLQAGVMLKLEVLAITAEYDRFFGLSSYSTKISFRF